MLRSSFAKPSEERLAIAFPKPPRLAQMHRIFAATFRGRPEKAVPSDQHIRLLHEEFVRAETKFIQQRREQLSAEQSQHLEWLLLLLGMKPAVLICPRYGKPRLCSAIAKDVWKPLVDSVSHITLSEITHDLVTCCGCQNWKGQWVAYNVAHDAYPTVKNALLTPRAIEVPLSETGAALGYPVRKCDDPRQFTCDIEYLCGGVPAFQYKANIRGDADLYIAHFLTTKLQCEAYVDLQFRIGSFVVPWHFLAALDGASCCRAAVAMEAIAYYASNSSYGSTVFGVRAPPLPAPFCLDNFINNLTGEDVTDELSVYMLKLPQAAFEDIVRALACGRNRGRAQA